MLSCGLIKDLCCYYCCGDYVIANVNFIIIVTIHNAYFSYDYIIIVTIHNDYFSYDYFAYDYFYYCYVFDYFSYS